MEKADNWRNFRWATAHRRLEIEGARDSTARPQRSPEVPQASGGQGSPRASRGSGHKHQQRGRDTWAAGVGVRAGGQQHQANCITWQSAFRVFYACPGGHRVGAVLCNKKKTGSKNVATRNSNKVFSNVRQPRE